MKRIALLLLFLAATSYACSCAPFQGYGELFDGSDLVFSGKVLSISRVYNGNLAEIEVEKYWKDSGGKFSERITVQTGFGDSDCGYNFRNGGQYLVYASARYDGETVHTGICSGTKPLSEAKGDLAWLSDGKVPEKPKIRPGDDPMNIAVPFVVVLVVVVLLGGIVYFAAKRKAA